MFIPVTDRNPLVNIRFAWMTWALIAVNCAIFAAQVFLLEEPARMAMYQAGGMTPVDLLNGLSGSTAYSAGLFGDTVPNLLTLISYQFLHGDVWHLVGNMIFLWIFGDNVEDALGHWRFAFFYLLCGVLAGLTHSVMNVSSDIPLIGASGATSGLVGAYLVLHPRVQMWVLALGRIPLRLPAWTIIGVWLSWQIWSIWQMQQNGPGPGVAWWAHVGGFIAGALLIIVMHKRNVPLLDRDLEVPPKQS